MIRITAFSTISVRLIQDRKPSVVGISCQSFNRFACLKIAQIAKAISPSTIVIFGGHHATFLAHQLLRHYPFIDYIVHGEGEITFCELLEAIRQQVPPGPYPRPLLSPVKKDFSPRHHARA